MIEGPDSTKVEYQLRVYLFNARNIAPAEKTGTSNPLVKIRCAGVMVESTVKERTLNPVWYETMILNVNLSALDR